MRLAPGGQVVVHVLNGSATFTTTVDRLDIDNHGSKADYEIELPADAAWVEIDVGAQQWLVQQGAQVVTDVPADASGAYVIPMTRHKP